jgi:hypothetical protein
VDFGPIEDEDDEYEFRGKWEHKLEVRFLQEHGIDHGGVTLRPRLSDPIYPFEGLELDQKEPKDPLDPICWYTLTLLAGYGTVFVCRCGYWRCEKFFFPLTQRRLYCSDSCRALQHVVKVSCKDRTARDKFHKEKAEYMRRYRANPRRRVIEYRRLEKAESIEDRT